MSQVVDKGPQAMNPLAPPHAALQSEARAWFEHLRDQICANFEQIESEIDAPLGDRPAGTFSQRSGSARPTPASRAAAA